MGVGAGGALRVLALRQEAYSVARQFNLIPPICEQAEYHMFQREKVEVQLPELFHKIGIAVGVLPQSPLPTKHGAPQSLVGHSVCYWGSWGAAASHPPALPSGVGAMTWSPLACGIVSGKYDGGIPPYSRASLKVSLAGGGRDGTGTAWGAGGPGATTRGVGGCPACTRSPYSCLPAQHPL